MEECEAEYSEITITITLPSGQELVLESEKVREVHIERDVRRLGLNVCSSLGRTITITTDD